MVTMTTKIQTMCTKCKNLEVPNRYGDNRKVGNAAVSLDVITTIYKQIRMFAFDYSHIVL